jgi:hypothetical protein
MPDPIKAILRSQNINLDTSRDYSSAELLTIYEKVIGFLDRRIKKITLPQTQEAPCDVNLDELAFLVENEFDTLGYDGLASKYNLANLSTLHTNVCYTIADTIIATCRKKGIPVISLWTDIVANYGIITKNQEA